VAATKKNIYKVLGGNSHQTETLMWSLRRVTEGGSSHPTRTLMLTPSQAAECGSIRQEDLDIKAWSSHRRCQQSSEQFVDAAFEPSPSAACQGDLATIGRVSQFEIALSESPLGVLAI
jgi:hypothetical protein